MQNERVKQEAFAALQRSKDELEIRVRQRTSDLDYFKAVNDQLGHDAGDTILVETGIRL